MIPFQRNPCLQVLSSYSPATGLSAGSSPIREAWACVVLEPSRPSLWVKSRALTDAPRRLLARALASWIDRPSLLAGRLGGRGQLSRPQNVPAQPS